MPGLTFNIFGHDVSASSTLRRVEGQADQSAKKIGGSFKTLGKVGLAAAIGGIGAVLKTGFDEAKDASAGTAQLAAGIKSTGNAANVSVKGLNNLASSIQGYSGQTDDSIVAAEKLLLTFTNIKNQGPDKIFDQATTAAADMAARLGGDASSNAIRLGKALNDPIKGITALTKVGVSFTAGQKAQITQMVKTGNTVGAQKMILAELNKEFGGSAKAAGQSLPGQLARAKRAFEDVSQQVVTALLPVIQKLITFLRDDLMPAFKAIVDFITAHKTTFIILASTIGTIVAVLKAWAIAQAILNAVMETNPIVLIATAIIALGVALVVAYKKSETFRNIVKGVFKAVSDAASFMWNNVIKPVFEALKTAFGVVRDVVRRIASAISTAFKAAGGGLKWIWDHVIGPVFSGIKSGINAVYTIVHKVTGWIGKQWDRMLGPLQKVWATMKGIFDDITGAFTSTMDLLSGGTYVKGVPNKGPAFNIQTIGQPQGSGTPRRNAQGTGFFSGGSTWMNELGPELVSLPRGAQIDTASTSASKMRMANGRSQKPVQHNTYNVTVNNNGPVARPESVSTPASIRAAANRLGGN